MVNITITLEERKSQFRNYRRQAFEAFDKWEKAVLRGREEDSPEIMAWYQTLLDFPDTITANTGWKDYPDIPEAVRRYF